jgi:HEAT repeat protein
VRSLGYLRDADAIGLLRDILTENIEPQTAHLYLAEAAIESLGRIGSSEAESILVETFGSLREYTQYVGWYSDHPALYACHASPVHARIIIALEQMGSTKAREIVPHLIRSIPTDPDRALFLQSDGYEILVGRVIERSGRAAEVIETCLSLLGDSKAVAADDIQQAISSTHSAWAGTPAADNRAAQVLSLLRINAKYEARIRASYERYRSMPEDPIDRPLGNPTWIPQRHWVLFYLGRTLGNLRELDSLDTLLASLDSNLNEARHGRPDPSEPNIHFLQLEYTPCWRAAAAWAAGKIGDRRAVATLVDVVRNMDNATDTRHAAAKALGDIADPGSRQTISELAQEYPEVSIRRALQEAAGRCISDIED